jgi:hypothetical protein
MAFDQATRNRLQSFVSDARELLTEEFTRQLQNDYGLDPVAGKVTPLENLAHLDDRRRETARILRVTLEHYQASNSAASNEALLERIVREQAFTVLNRLAALRMAEARELLIQAFSEGYNSQGFQLYGRLAGSGLGETGDAYQAYLFSLFDEFALDLPVLFDRFSPLGRLFPREAALLELLKLINDPELADLWAEDETIGWIYQYFNSQEERRQMRSESSAPRNSRELAVRNQFFTPRYVVEFLTDNTLGRIWYEMTRGETALKETCRYLVRRPVEVFLSEEESGQWTVGSGQQGEEDLSQEELMKQPFYVPYRYLKDPRDIRMLDPACGSMHFGLYAFDLYERIYAEAWDMQAATVGKIESGQWAVGGAQRADEDDGEVLSGVGRLAEGYGSGGSGLSGDESISEGRNVRSDQSIASGSGFDSVEYRRGTRSEIDQGVSELSRDRLRVASGGRDSDTYRSETGVSNTIRPNSLNSADSGSGSSYQRAIESALKAAGWSLTTGHRPLILDYPSKEELIREVPRLIIEHNIHGIDIDPRAAQIAGLSLWLRAQKSWHSQGLKPKDRPRIARSNVVCAEPMPGEAPLLEEFISSYLSDTPEERLVGQLVQRVFEAMKLAGEAGSLLPIEREISDDIQEAKQQWLNRPEGEQLKLIDIEADQPKQQTLALTVEDITDDRFWLQVEDAIYSALERYAATAEGTGQFQRRLFAEDAGRGFAFIDLCRKSYSVMLMNPPFGAGSLQTRSMLSSAYPRTKNDVYAAFVERGLQLLEASGHLGAITSRTGFFLSSFQKWREEILLKEAQPTVFADLGYGVLDAAMVETAAYCLSKR